MSKRDDGGLAFSNWHGNGWEDGMTLRQWYKGMALIGLRSHHGKSNTDQGDYDMARQAAADADALIAEDKKATR